MIEPPRLDDDAFSNLTQYIQGLLEQMETLPYPKVQEDVFALLNSLDHLHRESLTRLVELIEAKAPELKLPMANDFAIQTLMMLYNFVPPDELPATPSPHSTLIGIDEITIPEAGHPIWVPADALENIPVGEMRAYRLEGKRVVICRLEGDELYALENACPDSILPLDQGQLDAYRLHCPWHGCQYDLRTGEILNEPGSKRTLQTYPTQVTPNGRVQVGFHIPEWMR